MADERTLNTKESQRLAKRLKKLFKFGSRSTPQSRSNSPPVVPSDRVSSDDPAPPIDPAPNINPTAEVRRADSRGNHNVHDEFTFKNNPGFIFHDSPGFEAGGEKELKTVMSFIEERAKCRDVMHQIHAIWQRPGNVPVVAIFTKFDVLSTRVYDMNKDEEENKKNAHKTLKEKFEDPLRGYDYPPRAYVCFESIQEGGKGNHQEQVGELIKQTTASIDNLALKMLFVTVPQNNLQICIECALNE
ncbi:hypothetical protein H0H92_004100 [Tricholoma furcatifolium]|nr:hypothetical protein H0H92_004100 [Tricholoma furcatifolium]